MQCVCQGVDLLIGRDTVLPNQSTPLYFYAESHNHSHQQSSHREQIEIQCCVSIQGLHPSKDPAFAVFQGESFGETLLTASAVVIMGF